MRVWGASLKTGRGAVVRGTPSRPSCLPDDFVPGSVILSLTTGIFFLAL